MQHNFSSTTISTAMDEAGLSCSTHASQVDDFLFILPDPTPGVPIYAGNIRADDLVRCVSLDGSMHEGVVTQVTSSTIWWACAYMNRAEISAAYLISRPDPSPDPAVHEFVVDNIDGKIWRTNRLQTTYHLHGVARAPRDFTDWSPVTIEADHASR